MRAILYTLIFFSNLAYAEAPSLDLYSSSYTCAYGLGETMNEVAPILRENNIDALEALLGAWKCSPTGGPVAENPVPATPETMPYNSDPEVSDPVPFGDEVIVPPSITGPLYLGPDPASSGWMPLSPAARGL